jgi:hypothetical protein
LDLHAITGHPSAGSVRCPSDPAKSPTLGLTRLQFGPCSPPLANRLTRATSRWSPCPGCSACVDLRGHRRDIAGLGEERGYRVLCVCGKGTKVVLVTLPPPAGRRRPHARPGPAHSRSRRIDRYAATRRLRRLAGTTGIHGHQAAIPECCATRRHD